MGSRSGLSILPGPGFPTPEKPGLGNNAFLTKVGNNKKILEYHKVKSKNSIVKARNRNTLHHLGSKCAIRQF